MNKKLIPVFVALAVFSMFFAGMAFSAGTQEGEAAASQYLIRLSHGVPTNDPSDLGAQKFKELVEKYSNNRVKVEIYPNNQLGDEQEVAQDVQRGSLEAEILYTGNLQPLAPSVGVLMLPYMFTTSEEAWHAMDAILDELNERLVKEANVRVLGYFEKGFRVLSNSRKPVERLEDLQGLKIRVSPVAIAIETFKAWDLDPIPMAWAEVFSALQQKVIDGQENPYSALVTTKFYEIQKYVTEIHYMTWTGPLIISELFFQKAPKDIQEAMVRAGREAAVYQRKVAMEATGQAMTELKQKGMTLSGAPKDEQEWQKRAQALWPKFYETVGGKEWVDRVMELIKS